MSADAFPVEGSLLLNPSKPVCPRCYEHMETTPGPNEAFWVWVCWECGFMDMDTTVEPEDRTW